MTPRRSILAVLAASVAASALVVTGPDAAASFRSHAASLSFAEPRDFATGATPSADVLNRAEGDQLAFQLSRTTVSNTLAVGDFAEDAQGRTDVVVANVLAGSVSVFRADGRGGFREPTVIRVGVNPNFVVAADLDGDRHLDLALADVGANSVVTLLGDGGGGFAIDNVVPVPPSPRDLTVGDVNGDAVADITVASRNAMAPVGGVTVLTGEADGDGAVTYRAAQFLTLRKAGQPVGANTVALADLDGSGPDDLVIGAGASPSAGDRPPGSTEPTGDELLVYLNEGAGNTAAFAEAPSQRFRVGATPDALAAADWNGDAYVDLAVMSSQSGDVTTLTNDGSGRFAVKQVNVTVGALPRSLKVADVDNDGHADMATATFAMSTVSVLRGRGDGTFEPAADFWAGDAPSAVAVGHFDDDKRADIVAARFRDDELALLVNESPRPADGVVVSRDIAYAHDNQYGAHQMLDVYAPPPGTASFAGGGKRYPVFLFAHGGASVTGDKSMVAYLMRSLAREGIVAVTADYRLTSASDMDAQAGDYAAAFGWLRANAARFGGDPNRIVVGGTSAGSLAVSRFLALEDFAASQAHVRGVVHVGTAPNVPADAATASTVPPGLAIDGDAGIENALTPVGAAYKQVVRARGGEAWFVLVPDRDHLTIVSNLARPGDRGRTALLRFLRRAVA